MKRFCSHCGAEMSTYLKPADEVHIHLIAPDFFNDILLKMGDRYNPQTGKEQFVKMYKCPNYQQKKWYQFFSPHDEYHREEIVTE